MSSESSDMSAADLGSSAAGMASIIMLSKVLSVAVLGVSFIFISRMLGSSVYGIYVLATAIIGLFDAIGNFGIGSAFNKFISQYKRNPEKVSTILSSGFLILISVGVALSLLTFIFSGPISYYALHTAEYNYIVKFIAIAILASMLFGASYPILIGIGDRREAAISVLTEALVQGVLSVGLIVLGFGVLGPIIGLIAGYLSSFFVTIFFLKLKRVYKLVIPSKADLRQIFHFSLPIAVSNIFNTLAGNLSTVVLGILTTTIVLGNFGIASKINYIFDIILGSISLSLLSAFAIASSTKKNKSRLGVMYSYSLFIAVVFIAPVIFYMALFSTPLVNLLFGFTYKVAPLYISLISIGVLINFSASLASTMLMSINKVKQIMKNNIIISIIEIAIMPFAIYKLGGEGLIILLFLVAPVVNNFLFLRSAHRYIKFNINIWKISRVVISALVSAGMAFAVLQFLQFGSLFRVIAGIVIIAFVYPLFITVFRGAEDQDLENIKKFTKDIPVVRQFMSLIILYNESIIKRK